MTHAGDQPFREVSRGADSPAIGWPGGRDATTEFDGGHEAGRSATPDLSKLGQPDRRQPGQSKCIQDGSGAGSSVAASEQYLQQVVIGQRPGPEADELSLC
jgi:hypothetical protein